MASTFNDVRSAIEGRIATEMAVSPSYQVSYQNVPFTVPDDSPWVRTAIRFGDNAYATLMAPAAGKNRQVGTVVIEVFTQVGVGTGSNFVIAERLKGLFDRQTVSGIIFDAASGPAQVLPSSPEGHYQTQITITFEANQE
jgi:hypothetical protein